MFKYNYTIDNFEVDDNTKILMMIDARYLKDSIFYNVNNVKVTDILYTPLTEYAFVKTNYGNLANKNINYEHCVFYKPDVEINFILFKPKITKEMIYIATKLSRIKGVNFKIYSYKNDIFGKFVPDSKVIVMELIYPVIVKDKVKEIVDNIKTTIVI